jgi:hypothetical protein
VNRPRLCSLHCAKSLKSEDFLWEFKQGADERQKSRVRSSPPDRALPTSVSVKSRVRRFSAASLDVRNVIRLYAAVTFDLTGFRQLVFPKPTSVHFVAQSGLVEVSRVLLPRGWKPPERRTGFNRVEVSCYMMAHPD